MAGEHDKAQLIAELAIARARLTEAGHALKASAEAVKDKLDVSARAKASYGRHPVLWNAGAAVVGFLLARLPARKKVVYVERSTGQALGAGAKAGLLWGAVKFAAGLAKPLLSAFAGQKLGDLAQRFTGAASAGDEPPDENEP